MTSDLPDTIGHHFGAAALQHGDRLAIVAQDLSLSYANLWKVTCGFAVSMAASGVAPGSIVGITSRDMVASLAALLASSLLGAAIVSMDAEVWEDGVIRPTHLFRSPEMPAAADGRDILMTSSWPRAAESSGRYAPADYPVAPDGPRWFSHTSGTTGRAKYIALTGAQLLRRSLAMAEDFPPGRRVFCSLFPCYARVFQIRAVAALLMGATIVDTISVDFMRQHGVNVLLGSPRTVIDWLGGRTLSPMLEVVQSTGAQLAPGDIRPLLNSFRSLEDVYGASETSKAYKNIYTLTDGKVTSRGKRLDSEIEIVTPDGDVVAEKGSVGLLRVRNPYTVAGYIDAPEATARAFWRGWFVSGDFAAWGQNDELVIRGRANEVINLGGAKVNPLDVEAVLLGVPGVRLAYVGADPLQTTAHRLVALIAVSPLETASEIARNASRACDEQLLGVHVPALVLAVGELPVTTDGAPKRRDCENLLRQILKSKKPA